MIDALPRTAALPDGLWINLGSGPSCPPGWVSIDGSWQARLAGHPRLARLAESMTGRRVGHWPPGIVCRNVARGLGVPPGSAAVIFSSHLLEHLHRADALALLYDAHRALRPGGVCRIVTPDLAAAIDAYLGARGRDPAAADRLQHALLLHPADRERPGHLLGWYRRLTSFDHHKWLYDRDSLACLFREAGFDRPRACEFLESDIPADRLAQVEHCDRVCGGAGMCIEARR